VTGGLRRGPIKPTEAEHFIDVQAAPPPREGRRIVGPKGGTDPLAPRQASWRQSVLHDVRAPHSITLQGISQFVFHGAQVLSNDVDFGSLSSMATTARSSSNGIAT